MSNVDKELTRLVADLQRLVKDTGRYLERLDAYAHRKTPEPTDAVKLLRLEAMQREHAVSLTQVTEILTELNERHGRD